MTTGQIVGTAVFALTVFFGEVALIRLAWVREQAFSSVCSERGGIATRDLSRRMACVKGGA